MHWISGQKEKFARSMDQTYLLVLESFLKRLRRVGRWTLAHPGDIDTGGSCFGKHLPHEHCYWRLPSWLISAFKTWPYPKSCRCQCWDASDPTINWAGTQLHPLADRLPKDFLSPQPPLDMPLDMALLTRGPNPIPPTRGKALALPSRKPALPSDRKSVV